MTGRIIASLAFVAGGVVTWFILAALHAFGASQAGLSASAVSGPPSIEALIPWLACSYFLVSAVGVVACRKRESLRVVALLAHLLLLAAFLAVCSEGLGKGSEKFLTGLLLMLVITVVFFSPWLAVWGFLLFRRNDAA
jgi:hypothetical protein